MPSPICNSTYDALLCANQPPQPLSPRQTTRREWLGRLVRAQQCVVRRIANRAWHPQRRHKLRLRLWDAIGIALASICPHSMAVKEVVRYGQMRVEHGVRTADFGEGSPCYRLAKGESS